MVVQRNGTKHLLILGGTGEAAALAARVAENSRLRVTTSLAGRTQSPRAVAGSIRIGGFGGATGLAGYIDAAHVDLVVDATHPYASIISANAVTACEQTGTPLLSIERPPWHPSTGDRWHEVPDLQAAAHCLPRLGQRCFLSTGQRDLRAFGGLRDTWFLVRMIEPPPEPLPLPHHELLLARGPFNEEHETELLRSRAVEVLVSKNSGGIATYPKILAARRLDLPVLMIARPEVARANSTASVDGAIHWLREQIENDHEDQH